MGTGSRHTPPDLETRQAILAKKAVEMNVDLDPEVIELRGGSPETSVGWKEHLHASSVTPITDTSLLTFLCRESSPRHSSRRGSFDYHRREDSEEGLRLPSPPFSRYGK